MSDFPFSIPRRGDADVVNGVSYSGDTLTLTRAEGSDLTTTIATGDPVTGVSYSGDTLSLERATGADLTTTIATSDPTKIENGNSKMEIDTLNGACVFTPAGLTAKKTTFAADGSIITSGYVGIGDDAPDVPLQIKGDGANSSAALRVESTNAAGAGYMFLQRNSDGKSYVLNESNHPLILGANPASNGYTQLYLKENGNVGINKEVPEEKLHVDGNIKCSGGFKSATIGGTTTSSGGSELLVFEGAGDYPHLSIYGDNDAPSTKSVELGRGGAAGDGYLRLMKGGVLTDGIFLNGNGNSYIMGGNVGINKEVPSEKLDVDGNIKVTGNILGNGVEIATTSGACVFTPNGNAALATTFFADGKFNLNQQIRFNDLKGIGHAIDFLGLPNIQVGSAYAFANTNVGQTFERLMSYSKIGNMLNINGHFVFKPTATTGTAYMNYYDIGLAGGIDNKVYIISDLGNGIFTSITADAPNSRLLFNFTVGSSAVNVTQVATLKFFCGLSFRGSYG